MAIVHAFVGLGGNVGDRLATLRSAARTLRDGVPDTVLVACSSIWECRPLGPSETDFLNAAVELRTTLAPETLLAALLAVERAHGRVRRERWAPRTLDLDLLFVGARDRAGGWQAIVREASGLRLPHPEAHRRDFVLLPLCELAPDLPLGPRTTASDHLAALADGERTALRRLSDPLRPV